MRTTSVEPEDFQGVFAVPPLARRADAARSLDFEQNDLIVRHIMTGGITRLIYGGNAFIYHVTLAEFEQLLDWLEGLADRLWIIPSIGPSFGRAMDQALVLRKFQFPCAMVLPCGDPRDASGLEQGYREIAAAAATKLLLYLKDENGLGVEKEAGLDAVARLVDDGVCVGIKYAVVREDPGQDDYLKGLLKRVDRRIVISGIGERPAVIHLRDWQLTGFTTGSGCIAPRLSQRIFAACQHGNFEEAQSLRADFLPLEDLRDSLGPARVLHAAVERAGIARAGGIPPFVSSVNEDSENEIGEVARELLAKNANVLSETAAVESVPGAVATG